jgi:predicted aspartyl protease
MFAGVGPVKRTIVAQRIRPQYYSDAPVRTRGDRFGGDPLAPLRDVSRRQFLRYGAASLALTSIVARAQTLPAPQTLSAPRGTTERDPAAVDTATDATKRLSVAVRIDGNGPYRFLVDTGADRTVLASDVAVDLGLLRGERVMMEGVVRALATDTVTLHELTFGSIKCKQLVVPVLPRALLEADGYLGLDTLDRHRVTLDFKNHTLQVSEPRSRFSAWWVRQNESRIRASGSAGHLRAVNCIVDGVAATAFIDTGAEVSAGNAALLAALNRGKRARYAVNAVPLTDITGGKISGSVTTVNKIKLMDLEFTDCPLVIADFQIFDIWGLRQVPALLIGMNFLRQFAKISIDYGLKELRFDLTQGSGTAAAKLV